MFWMLLGYIVALKRVLVQEIGLGSPDRFFLWEDGCGEEGWGGDGGGV